MTGESRCITTVVQYGVRTPHSNAVLTVTTDRAVAERELEWIHGGQIVTRTVTTSTWQITVAEPRAGDVADGRAQLLEQVAKRAVIDQAIGIIRSRNGASAEEALARLTHVSQTDGVDLADAARRLVEHAVQRSRMLRP